MVRVFSEQRCETHSMPLLRIRTPFRLCLSRIHHKFAVFTKIRGMRSRPGMSLFVAAACIGLLHAAASLYWALGGTWLLDTVGQFAVDMVRSGGSSTTIMLCTVTIVKVAGALIPLIDHAHLPAHRWVRVMSTLGIVTLLLWGGVGMISAWVCLATGESAGFDRALVGHAYLWDPLFVLWGLCLAGALFQSRRWWREGGSALSDR